MTRLVLLACLLVTSSASAEPGFGIAVNNPIMWRDQESMGGSFYYRFLPKQFIRLNLAYYRHAGTPVQHAIDFAREGWLDDGDNRSTGRATDLGVGWMYFPRRAFDGPTVELGVLLRDDTRSGDAMNTTLTKHAARALVGWSWLYRDRWFASVAAGGSVGKANGTEWSNNMSRVSFATASFEGYVRVGLVFGN